MYAQTICYLFYFLHVWEIQKTSYNTVICSHLIRYINAISWIPRKIIQNRDNKQRTIWNLSSFEKIHKITRRKDGTKNSSLQILINDLTEG